MIDTFTKQEFEAALPTSFDPLGLVKGEYCYLVKIDEKVGIYIRSSIGKNRMNRSVGKDSIRVHLVKYYLVSGEYKHNCVYAYKSMGSKLQKYITRVPGWQRRLNKKIELLRELRLSVGDCNECDEPFAIFKVKKEGRNKGRLFSKCSEKLCTSPTSPNFVWIT